MAEGLKRSSSRFSGLLISNLVYTTTRLGSGADATVYEVDWNGTVCAAKRLHDILLEDQSPGGVAKLIGNFEAECLTWSKLRHPGVVQFLGVYLERSSRLPVLVMEKMDTSLRMHLESHRKEEFLFQLKVFVLRQVTQALSYLHNQNPILVHHDLSPNNVLLSHPSFVAKVSDFGMSRAINPSVLSRKSSIRGTQAFMAPEALHDPPRYNEKLDVFSFGNIILSTLTHEWPDPGPPKRYAGDQLVALSELQRRDRYVVMFTAQEKQLFLPVVGQCLQDQPDKRPSSAVLVQELRRIESSLPRVDQIAAPIEQLRQQLSAKEEECKQKDKLLRGVIKEKNDVIAQKSDSLMAKDVVIRDNVATIKNKDKALWHLDRVIHEKDEELAEKDSALRYKDVVLREKNEALEKNGAAMKVLQAENQQLRSQLDKATKGTLLVKHPLRNWTKLGKTQIIQHSPEGGRYGAVAVNSQGLLAVADGETSCVHLLTSEGTLVRSIGKGALAQGALPGVAFDLIGNVWVVDYLSGRVVKLSQDGQYLLAINHAGGESDPKGVSVSPEGLIYICDRGNHCCTVHDKEGKRLFAFGSKGSGPGCINRPSDVVFGSDGLVYISDFGNKRISVWSKEGTYKRDFKTNGSPTCIASTSDDHLLVTSYSSDFVMVYTLEGELICEFGGKGSQTGRFDEPLGICVDGSGVVYVADKGNKRVQVFWGVLSFCRFL